MGILFLIIDIFVLMGIVGMLAKTNVMDEVFRFVGLSFAIVAIHVAMLLLGFPPPIIPPLYFGACMLGFRFIAGMTWRGAFLGAGIYLVWKLAIGFLFSGGD